MKYFLVLITIFATIYLKAQNSFNRNNQFQVLNFEGDTLLNPWAGGFNSVQFSEIDLNLDGIKDLFVFDRTGNRISTFINLGLSGQVSYRHAPQYAALFPDSLSDWVLLRDFNCDGKEDIFTSYGGGVKVYINTSVTQLQFNLHTNQVLYNSQPDSITPSFTNLYVNASNIPAIDDIDNDGDLDFIVLSLIGNRMFYIQNLSQENYGTCDYLEFQMGNRCWGFVSEHPSENKVILNDTCSSNIGNPGKHLGGSSFLTLDLDANESKELLIGGNAFDNLLLLINADETTNLTSSTISSQDTTFPTNYGNAMALKLDHFLAGYYLDINNDGVKDLISSTNALTICSNSNNVWSYINSNASDMPDFNFSTNAFLQEGMIEVGSGASPAFVDYNADGKLDLVVGNFGLFDLEVTDNYIASLWLYENIGTLTHPAFQLVDSNYANIASLTLDSSNNDKSFVLSPTFGDLDGDGDQDMMLGDFSGKLHYFENNAGPGNAMNLVLNQAQYLGIDVGKNCAPQLIDLDRDLLLDLVVGRQDGFLSYFKNTGTASMPSFSLITDSLGGVNTRRDGEFDGYSTPFVYENSGQYEIICGAQNGFIYRFGNIDLNLSGVFSVDSSYQNIWEGINSTIAMADLNNDNLVDLVIGNMSGGLALYTGDSSFVSVREKESPLNLVKVYPNPARDEVYVDLGALIYEGALLEVFNGLGQFIWRQKVTAQKTKIKISKFPSGMYFVRYRSKEDTLVFKVFKE
jgi:hypothetical protein